MNMSEVSSDVEAVEWRKARRSMGNGNCLEIATVPGGIAVRDSKDPFGPALAYGAGSWRAFTRNARLGRYDTPEA